MGKILDNNAISFSQPDNKEMYLEAVMDGYKKYVDHDYYLADILQKDAIQNSWGARKTRKGEEWKCIFSYYENKGNYFRYNDVLIKELVSIRDEGTWGLTGEIPYSANDIRTNLSKANKEEERISGFLSQNWTTKTKEDLGSRGIGKAIFIVSSKDKIIFFDSLRVTDKKYIFGSIFLDKKTKEIQQEFLEDDQGKRKFISIFKNISKPLSNFGTRIIIVNPDEKLIEAFKNRKIDDFIKLTWWEILVKYNAQIEIKILGEKERRVENSPYLPIIKNNYSKTYENITLGNFGKIKRISLSYVKDIDLLPKDYSEKIFIQRGGMLIERYEINKLLDEDFSANIYGSVEFDKDLEKEMKDKEVPEHYSFYWQYKPPTLVRDQLRKALKNFCMELNLLKKYNTNITEKQIKIHSKLNELFYKLSKKYKIFGKIKTTPIERSISYKEKEFPIRLSMPDFKLPAQNQRVNYGEMIFGAYVKLINETDKDIKVKVSISIFKKPNGRNERTIDNKVEDFIIYKQTYLSDSNLKIGWDQIKINKNKFEKGRYVIRAIMRSLEERTDIEKGEKIYTISKAFYVEEDPSGKDLFDWKVINSDKKDDYIRFEDDDDKITVIYNQKHPFIKKYLDNNDKKGEANFYDLLLNEVLNYYVAKFLGKDEKEEIENYFNIINELLKVKGEILFDYL